MRTGRGEHRGYRHPGVPVSNEVGIYTGDPNIKIDVRGDGGYVVAPGSIHASGVPYEWAGPPFSIADLPVFDPAWLTRVTASKPKDLPPTIPKGQQNDTLFREGCRLRQRGWEEEEIAEALWSLHRHRSQGPDVLHERGDMDKLAKSICQQYKRGDLGFSRDIEFICAAEVTVVKLKWLYYARLAHGAITLVEGGPEKGKSTILCDFAARVSRGESFPGETETRAPGNVVMLVAEDDIATTVVPRLMAAGADLKRIFFVGVTKDERGNVVPFHMSDDCERLQTKCEEVNAMLVIVDPLVSFIGSRKGKTVNTNNDLEVRKSLAPLKDLAEQLQASVAAIRHYRKGNGTDALEAGGGSVGFAALVRVIIAALPDPDSEDDNHYLLAVAKNNLVAKSKRPALAYEIVPSADDPDIGQIAWGATVEKSANEVLEAIVAARAAAKHSGKVALAKEFLETYLPTDVWVLSKDIMKDGKELHGLSEDAIRRGKDELPEVIPEKRGAVWGWIRKSGEM